MSEIPKAEEILKSLLNGNARYVAADSSSAATPGGQHDDLDPMAAFVVCSDQHSFVHDVFCLGPQQLYVMQTAASCVGDTEAEGTVYAKHTYGINLVVVLGHQRCSTLDACKEDPIQPLGDISREVHASLTKIKTNGDTRVGSTDDLAKVHASRMAAILREKLGGTSGITVAAACLDDTTGIVEFL